MPNPKTPGVSVEEITRLPYSVELVETATPVFIGYTELQPDDYDNPLRISSLLEYEKHFGKAKREIIQLQDTKDKGVKLIAPEAKFLMYYSLQLYFANGGGACYIVSVGSYTSAGVQLASHEAGLNMIEGIDEPILIVFPDAVSLTEPDFYNIYNQTIEKLETKNWFAILDTYHGNSTTISNNFNTIGNFRADVHSTSRAAAYFPHLKTILNYSFDEDEAPIIHKGLQQEGESNATFYAHKIDALEGLKILASEEILSESADASVLADLLDQAIAIAEEINETADDTAGQTIDAKANLVFAINEAKFVLNAIHNGTIDGFAIPENLDKDAPVFKGEFDALKNAILNVQDLVGSANGLTFKSLQLSDSLLYNKIKEAIKSLKVVLPPSSAIAGVYGRIDSTRGVWKAPANVSLNDVVATTEKVSDEEQSELNIHSSGKSINAIRTFTGKGILVWGARTIDGKDKKEDLTDNEWKYVHVRRYCNMIEQSISIALKTFIDEPAIPSTYLRAKTMLENFLNQQWMEGALAGNTPKEAYKVEVDGSTDVNNHHILNAKIEIALVRPAEFIKLNFSHKLQQS
ncbi:phage tail sheath family protein [Chryseobacterium luquanense]|uniref:Phage tail sheath subtilisin-like domain-containing protein n=1 Tax=Chryseobacterium luquanense TaxID=2983766 RepID=A0ABT3Y4M7_9FLAO|nr:phage tail sheath C-terminal domain-containing protein [Chryseobacterium luquanense]MCX8533026.1 phage tail sheath subtilisin-like domain-containing protein [Chryseobacterium luquanense]